MTDEMFAKLVGRIMAGVQVPLSMGLLGAARDPWVRLRGAIGLGSGWFTPEDAEKAVLAWLHSEEARR